jgi:SAM-dependent methyltransferase
MKKIKFCRSCKSKKLSKLFSLGEQFYSGIFPKTKKTFVPKGKLTLIICKSCSLVQLDENFSSKKMYGLNYGYRTSLNQSMRDHIISKNYYLNQIIELKKNDTILDIGSNDGTFLNSFKKNKFKLIGIDPTIKKFTNYYRNDIIKAAKFFSYNSFKNISNNSKAKLITSFAMFYDLKDPVKFAKDIYKSLDNNGIWHFEQSYLVDMIKRNSYDTICHEHLEYYSIHSINYIMKRSNFKIIDIRRNEINGGSIAITAAKESSDYNECRKNLNLYLNKEKKIGHDKKKTYTRFYQIIKKEKEILNNFLLEIKKSGKKIIGYGASTKGNIILQWCNINNKILDYIYDINKDKNNTFTPGTLIPIVGENKLKNINFDYFFVLPWHFKNFILKKEKKYIFKKKKFIFPMPRLNVV